MCLGQLILQPLVGACAPLRITADRFPGQCPPQRLASITEQRFVGGGIEQRIPEAPLACATTQQRISDDVCRFRFSGAAPDMRRCRPEDHQRNGVGFVDASRIIGRQHTVEPALALGLIAQHTDNLGIDLMRGPCASPLVGELV